MIGFVEDRTTHATSDTMDRRVCSAVVYIYVYRYTDLFLIGWTFVSCFVLVSPPSAPRRRGAVQING